VSFILDALRKSENERQRGAVPGISSVPFAVPRQRLPTWTLAVIGLLGLSVVALGGAWWQSSTSGSVPAPGPTASSPSTNVPIDIPALSARNAGGASSAAEQPPNLTANEPVNSSGFSAPAQAPESLAGAAVRTAETPPGASQPAFVGVWQTLPTAATLAAEGIALPQLRLELHVFYRDRPADRLVIINGGRYREGDVITEGPRVVAIEATGALLAYEGREFTLSAD
jgi:general secretion pathway protein B